MENIRWNEVITSSILKGWENITETEKLVLKERKYELDNIFSFSEDNILKLRSINDALHEQEPELFAHASRVRKVQKEWLENNFISDYEIDVKVELWSSIYNHLHPDIKDYCFYESHISAFGNKINDPNPVFLNDNWNDFAANPQHPLSKEFHCYTFHHIYDHTYLSWQDILEVEDVWIEINLYNQFLITLQNK